MADGAGSRQVVLIGGGHAHVEALDAFRRGGAPGLAVTLVSREPATPYSGLLPAYVAGLDTRASMEIDLATLAPVCGARFVVGDVVAVDRAARLVRLSDGRALPYDIASLDIGIAPDLSRLPGAAEHGVPVKPIARFADRWEAYRSALERERTQPRVAIVGGGVAGVELAMAIRAALSERHPRVTLVCEGEPAASLNPGARALLRRALAERGIAVEPSGAVRLDAGAVILDDGRTMGCDVAFVTTGAAAPPLAAASGLPVDADGFLSVGETLQVQGEPDLFGAGDCATMAAHPRPKAGVFAVRQGAPLARNILLRAAGRPCRPFVPQRAHLVLVGTGDGRAVAARGGWLSASGRLPWWLKRWLDRRWMARFRP